VLRYWYRRLSFVGEYERGGRLERLKNLKPVRKLFFLGIAYFSVVVPLAMIEVVSSEVVVTSGQIYIYLLFAGLALELILRRL
jgi:hypothetical protein